MKLSPQPWMTSPAIKRLFEAVPNSAATLRFVGGCVRDAIINKTVQDIDLATSYKPEHMMEVLQDAGIKVIPSGLAHGTVMAVLEGQGFEITTLRRDEKTDGRHATVAFTDCWEEDSARRDFTFNALYLSQNGDVYDPWNGVQDLHDGVVRFIGTAEARIQEDYLRILRYFRFYARFSKRVPDAETLRALTDNRHGLEDISGERIHSELLRLLKNPAPLESLDVMAKTHVLEVLTQQPAIPECFGKLLDLEQRFALAPSPLTRLYNLVDQSPEKLSWILKRYKFSGKEHKWLLKLESMVEKQADQPLKINLHFQGQEHTRALLLCLAAKGAGLSKKTIDTVQNWEHKPFPLTGKDLIKQGIKPGPDLGKELYRREYEWVLKGV